MWRDSVRFLDLDFGEALAGERKQPLGEASSPSGR
jgi:hypothetical protein